MDEPVGPVRRVVDHRLAEALDHDGKLTQETAVSALEVSAVLRP